jgi:hypothetical protein
MEEDHTEESSDGTLARGDDHSNYTHMQEYVEVLLTLRRMLRLRSCLKMIKAEKRGQSNLNMLLTMKLM